LGKAYTYLRSRCGFGSWVWRVMYCNVLRCYKLAPCSIHYVPNRRQLEQVSKCLATFSSEGPSLRCRVASEPTQQPTMFGIPGLPCRPWWDNLSGLTNLLEAECASIREEFLALRALRGQEQSVQQLQVTASVQGGFWSRFSLMDEGQWHAAHCALCPRTTALLTALNGQQGITLCRSIMGYAYFSIIEPGTNILPHYGMTNAKLRVQLSLIAAPDPPSWIRVAGETHIYLEGQAFVFDDCYLHSVSNPSNQERVVLLFDIWHPALCEESLSLLMGRFAPDRPPDSDSAFTKELALAVLQWLDEASVRAAALVCRDWHEAACDPDLLATISARQQTSRVMAF